MAIKKTFNGATLSRPGAYSRTVVENLTGFPSSETGIVAIVGEALGGEPRVLDILTKSQIQDAKSRYKSGPIADALELLASPSKDPRVPNGASKIIVYKVNSSTQSELSLKNASSVVAVALKSKNYGSDENNLNGQLTAGSVEDAQASIEGTVEGSFTLSGGETLIVRANGTNYTFTNTLTGSTTAAALVAELNTAARWSSSVKPVIAEVVETTRISIKLDETVVTAGVLDYGYLKIDASSTLDTIVGITGSARGVKGSRVLSLKKGSKSETLNEVGVDSMLSVKYTGAGTSAKLDVKMSSGKKILTTTVVGASGEDLSIELQDADGKATMTVQELVDQLNAQSAYEATVLAPNPATNADHLDFYNDITLLDVAAVLKKDIKQLVDTVNDFSSLAVAEAVDDVVGALATHSSAQFFTGATNGSMTNSAWSDAFEALKTVRVNHVVPLISEDVGSVTIDSVNALADTHVGWGWSTEGRSERQAWVSKLGSKAALKAAAKALNSGYTSILGHDVRVTDKSGSLVWLAPWAAACIAAGLKAGAGVGEPITYKVVNVNDIRVRDGSWDVKKDYAEMIDAGVTLLEPMDAAGFRFVLGNTTYGTDANFVWNRSSVVEAAGFVAYDLRLNLEAVFTGTKARTGTAEAIANFIRARMSTYLRDEVIVGDDLNEGQGYRNLSVSVEGNTAAINISITPVQGVDFLLPTIYLADIRQSA